MSDHDRAYHTPHKLAAEFFDPDAKQRSRLAHDPLLASLSEPRPWMDDLMRDALDRLMLIANGKTSSFAPKITYGSKEYDAMADVHLAGVDRLMLRYEGSRTHWQRLRVIQFAQEEVVRLRYAPDRSLMRGTREWRERIALDSRPSRDVALVYGISHMTVTRIRKAFA